jgi:hypothetical protein
MLPRVPEPLEAVEVDLSGPKSGYAEHGLPKSRVSATGLNMLNTERVISYVGEGIKDLMFQQCGIIIIIMIISALSLYYTIYYAYHVNLAESSLKKQLHRPSTSLGVSSSTTNPAPYAMQTLPRYWGDVFCPSRCAQHRPDQSHSPSQSLNYSVFHQL